MPFDRLRSAPVGGFKVSNDAGYAITTAVDEYGVMELLEIYVEPKYRRHGGGSRLVELLRDWGAAHGAKRIIAQCSPRNAVGESFYAALGMRPVSVVYQQDLGGEG